MKTISHELAQQQKIMEELKKQTFLKSITPQIMVDDSLKALRNIQANTIDMIMADPPYNTGRVNARVDWDRRQEMPDYIYWLRPYLAECQRVLKSTGMFAIFGVPQNLAYVKVELDSLMKFQNWIVWHKKQGGNNAHILMRRHEDILLYSKTDHPWFSAEAVSEPRKPENVRTYGGKTYDTKNIADVWQFDTVDSASPDRTDHPTQKPVNLIKRLVEIGCPEDGVVLDPFGGSGTTSVAAMELHRRSIYCEINEAYVGMAEARFAKAKLSTKIS